MAPGQDYRAWFHGTITQNYYTLGEATRTHDRWLAHPDQNPPRATYNQASRHIPRDDMVTPPYLPSFNPNRPQTHTTRPSSPDAKDSDSDETINIRTQTYAETMTLGPDDPNAVIDSGAMMTTVPRRLLLGTPWEDTIHPARPGTTIRYGNMETETVEDAARVGNYEASIVPDRFKTALLCVHDIVSTGHTVLFTDNGVFIEDIGDRYSLNIPRIPASREWRAPLNVLQRLTELRTQHPIQQAQPHPDHHSRN